MKNVFNKTLLFIGMLQFVNFAHAAQDYPVGSCGYRLVESGGEDSSDTENFKDDSTCPWTEGWNYTLTHTMPEMLADAERMSTNTEGGNQEIESEYPLVHSKKTLELIYKVYESKETDNKKEEIDSFLSLLSDVAKDIKQLSKNPEDFDCVLADSIENSVNQIQKHEFPNLERKFACVHKYASDITDSLNERNYIRIP